MDTYEDIAAAAPGNGQGLASVLVCDVNGRRYGFWASGVREIVRAVAITRLPDAPPAIEGVIDFRGRLLPVLDLRAAFGLPARPVDVSDHLVIVEAPLGPAAVRVDVPLAVEAVSAGQVRSVADAAPASGHTPGAVTLPQGLVLICDLAAFLSAAQAAQVGELIEARRREAV